MRGAVYKRGSTWTWHFDIDPDPLTGRRRQRTKGGYKTKKAPSRHWLRPSANGERAGSPSVPPIASATSFSRSGYRR
jgi:Arm DNA-binding domain